MLGITSSFPGVPTLLVDDYQDVLVHLAWHRQSDQRTLVFGFVELYPSEVTPSDATPERCARFGKKPGYSAYVKRYRLPAADAIA